MRKRLLESDSVPNALFLGARHVELPAGRSANRGAAAVPDAVAHVSVGRVVDPCFPQVAEILLVLVDLLVAAGQIQRDLRHVVDTGVADVPHRNPRVGVTLLDLHEALGRAQVRRRADADILGADLLQEEKLLVGRLGIRLRAELDPRLNRVHRRRAFARRRQQGRAAKSAAYSDLAECSAVRIRLSIINAHTQSPSIVDRAYLIRS